MVVTSETYSINYFDRFSQVLGRMVGMSVSKTANASS